MANLDLIHWVRFAPDLGNNRELLKGEQLALLIAVGLSKAQLNKFHRVAELDGLAVADVQGAEVDGKPMVDLEATEALVHDQTADLLAEGWASFVRVAPGSHSINGRTISTLRDYLRVVLEQHGSYNYLELLREVGRLNTVKGTSALFSEPPAGGSTSTPTPVAAPGGSQTGGR